MWGLTSAVAAFRGDEEAGRHEFVLAGLVTRRRNALTVLAALGIGAAALWLALVIGLLAGRLPLGGSAYLAVTTLSPVPVFVAVPSARRSAPDDLRLLSPTAHALRSERGSLLAWAAGIGFFAEIVGLLADSFTSSKIPAALRDELETAGVSIVTPAGALGFYFLFFVLAICIHDLRRIQWGWAHGVHPWQMEETGLLPPQAQIPVTCGLVAATLLWELVGALLGAPEWSLSLSPFHEIGLVPAQPLEVGAAAVMLAIGAAAAVRVFERRDLTPD